MRGLAVSAALLSGLVAAADVEKPTFTPTTIKAPFLEQFTGDWQERWTPSEATKKTPVGSETYSYVGKWSVEEPFKEVSIVGDKGLVAKDKATHHAISAPIANPVNPKGKTLVVQYEAKFQKVGNCGGGYVKLLEAGALANKEFSDTTPWVIMFGPDLTCPGTKVHFIFRHQNPITKEWEEKHLKTAPSPVIDDFTKLYTLIVNPDNTYKVLIDDEVASEGSLLEDFSPSVNPDKEIDDPEDKKPEDWVDEAQIRDPTATKPDDWDEDEPFQIVDEDTKKAASDENVLARLKEDPAGFVREKVMDFVEDVQEEGPIAALQSNPQVGGAIVASLLTLFGAIGAIFGVVGSSAQPVVKSVKKTATSPAAADGAKKTPKDAPATAASEPAAATSSTATSKDTPVKKRK
ncbi:hypothetical protein FRC01_001604 [Tulasnella sp. 417]|nr:hypothetical protein FRC01_001604 [Tulasnella sp. 417]